MIIDKFFNYKINAYSISVQIIKILKKRKHMQIDAMYSELVKYNEETTYQIFNESIGLLFLTGKIDYILETNNMEITNEIN